MAYKYKVLLGLGSLILVLDQLTKWWILTHVAIGDFIPVIPGFFDIVHVRNTGAAFGWLANLEDRFRIPFFYFVSFVAACVLVYSFVALKKEEHFFTIPLSLISGGVLGNLVDRIRFGNVVDFISLHVYDKMLGNIRLEWPAFNIADSAITVAMIFLAVHFFKTE